MESKATLVETQQKLERCRKLKRKNLCTPQELEIHAAAHLRAQASHTGADAMVAQAKGVLNVDKSNLKKAVIRSPIDGIVLSRKIEPGQTVAASFETPVLFTLAEDLRHMTLYVDIDEAEMAAYAARIIQFVDGRIESDHTMETTEKCS